MPGLIQRLRDTSWRQHYKSMGHAELDVWQAACDEAADKIAAVIKKFLAKHDGAQLDEHHLVVAGAGRPPAQPFLVEGPQTGKVVVVKLVPC